MITLQVFAACVAVWVIATPALAQTIHEEGENLMPAQSVSSTLNVPGASIYYERRGTGPLLIIIPGGPQDAGVFDEIADLLSDSYTVVSFDPRGNSRSKTGEPAGDLDVDVHADDVAALIDTLGNAPAFVFGTSGGAQIGLNLAARHPGAVAVLIAHEPPSMMMLTDPSEALAADLALYETYKREGVDAAMAQFFSDNGLGEGAAGEEMPPELAETFQRVSGNFEYWLAHGMLPLAQYRPDVETLRNGTPRIALALGEESRGQPIYDMGIALATRLDLAPVQFPGDHMGYASRPEAFAEALERVLSEQD